MAERFLPSKQDVRDMVKVAIIVATGMTAIMGPPLAYEQGKIDQCNDLRRQGIVIPDQPGDPAIGTVVNHDACGNPEYGTPGAQPIDPFNPGF